MVGRPPRVITVARVQAIEITLNWRWGPVLALSTWLLAHDVLPARFPAWDLQSVWMTSAAVVVAAEAGLLLHELGHALVARGRGQLVRRIVFHGFRAETVCSERILPPPSEVLIALAGPAVNLALAGLFETLRIVLGTEGPLDVVLLLFVLGNLATAAMSLVPIGPSDGRRALNAYKVFTNPGCQSNAS